MAIYTFECPTCGSKKEALVKKGDANPICNKHEGPGGMPIIMVQILSVPSPMQWGCRKF